jgi:lipoprotein NlpD
VSTHRQRVPLTRAAGVSAIGCALLMMSACSTPPVSTGKYTVRSGDTLYSIASRYHLDYHDLARWNGLGKDFAIHPGQILALNGSGKTARPVSKTQSTSTKSPVQTPVQPAALMPAWTWPVDGGVANAVERPNGGQGLVITGIAGQEVRAASAGRVVYTGTGLLGYGQLVIVKHNEVYLTAYGYTQSVLVHEGDDVRSGQAIATMGSGPQGTPMLYFEIRLNGKPVEAQPLLPRR